MKVGVFDSGVGGLSVLRSLLRANLFEEVVYYGDTARVPYGSKSVETIRQFSLEAVEFFCECGGEKWQKMCYEFSENSNLCENTKSPIDLLVVACNTVSATAIEQMRARAPFGVVGVIEAGVARAVEVLKKDAKILVIATKATVASGAYEAGLKAAGFSSVFSLATPLFVPLVEEGVLGGALLKSAFHHYFDGLGFEPDAVILGCTHFPFLSEALQEFFGEKTRLIHSGEAMVAYLKANFTFGEFAGQTRTRFYASSDLKTLEKRAREWLL